MKNGIEKGLLIIFSGPSGVGKGTIRKAVMADKKFNLAFSVSMTTRAPRNGEVDGVDYYFVSKEEFDRNIENDNFIEWAEFVGNKYGTPKDKVEDLRNQGKNVLLEIEINGAKQVLERFKGDTSVISIFCLPPSLEELEKRIRGRSTESDEIIKERLEKARTEIGLKGLYDYSVLNDNVNKAAAEFKRIVKSCYKNELIMRKRLEKYKKVA